MLGLRAYSAHKDKIAERYAKRVPVEVQRLSIRGVENAGKISEFLYRGAQPRGQGYEELKKMGIAIVVDLRNSKPERDSGETREQVKVEAAEEEHAPKTKAKKAAAKKAAPKKAAAKKPAKKK